MKNRQNWKVQFAAYVLVATLVGCVATPLPPQAAGAETTGVTRAPTGTPTATALNSNQSALETTKLLPPLDVELRGSDALAQVGTPISMTIVMTPHVAIHELRLTVEATGTVSLDGNTALNYEEVQAGEAISHEFNALIQDLGAGEIHAEVNAYDESTQLLFGRATILYVLAAETEVLAATSSPLLLQLEHLENQRDRGEISAEDYQRQRQKIRGGGATETIQIIQPTATTIP